LAAMLLHGIWNGLSLYGTAGLVAGYVIMSGVLIGLISVLVADRRRVVRLIHRYLPGYERTGLVTDDDIAMLSSLSVRGPARRWARAVAASPRPRRCPTTSWPRPSWRWPARRRTAASLTS